MATSEQQAVHVIREVAIRYIGRGKRAPEAMRGPADICAFLRRAITDDAREHFVALYLDGRHKAVAHQIVSIGTATASLVHPREVFQPAILLGACAVVVAHNHPSGDPTPSSEDREVTQRLAEAGKLLGIPLLDSIVWTRQGRFVSLREIAPGLL